MYAEISKFYRNLAEIRNLVSIFPNFEGFCKGVALQYILYSNLRPQSRRKSKVKVRLTDFLAGQKSSIEFLVYTTINTFRDSCVNVILQKFTRDWTRVKHDFKQKSKVKADFSLTVHLDRGRRSEYSEHLSATPLFCQWRTPPEALVIGCSIKKSSQEFSLVNKRP